MRRELEHPWAELAQVVSRGAVSEIKFRAVGVARGNALDTFNLGRLLRSGWVLGEVLPGRLLLANREGLKIWCRTDVGYDFGHLVEIFIWGIYRGDYSGTTVIDVGASTGESALYFVSHGAKHVIGLEPHPGSAKLAVENVHLNGLDACVTVLNAAVGDTIGRTRLLGSRLNPNAASTVPVDVLPDHVESYEAPTETIDGLTGRFGIETLTLKMDCEGAEYAILRAMTPPVWNRISSIQIEYHNGLQDLADRAIQNGFALSPALDPENQTLVFDRLAGRLGLTRQSGVGLLRCARNGAQ